MPNTIDDESRRAARAGALTSDRYAEADAEIVALFSDWLATSRRLEAVVDGPVADLDRFRDHLREASWMLGDADRVLDDPRMLDLRDRAVDAFTTG